MKKPASVIFFLSIAIFSQSLAYGVTTSIWRDAAQGDFDKGELRSTSTTSKDELILGPSVKLLYDSTQLYIWSLVVDGEGRIYAGSGNNGAIYKIEDGKGSLLYDSPEIAIHSLALDKEGNIYVGSSPRGIVYKVRADGSAQVFCDLEEEYIWALLFDSQENLLVATGQRGRVYKISPQGEVKQIYDSPETHILSLAIDNEDNLYAGSEGQGIIYKITQEGKIFALYDPPQNEIHSLVLDSQNNLYASAMGKGAGGQGPPSAIPFPSPQSKEGGEEKVLSSLIYKITPQGDSVEWFCSREAIILSLAVDQEDNLYVGTGNGGLIYKINPQQEATTLLEASEPQVLSLACADNRIYFSTGNLGRLYEFSSIHYAKEGTFESRVYDAKFITKWGNISWKGQMPRGTKITLTTRSGNTKKPGDTWSPWSKEYKDSKGASVVSPPARFIQYQATLSTVNRGITPAITEVSLALLPRNQAPQILAIKVPELGEERPPPSEKEGKPSLPNSAQVKKENQGKKTISWEARDPNGDSLMYDLYFRGEEEAKWKELEKEIKETSYSWDSLTFPDGIYLVRLVANDSPDNPPDIALTDEEISQPFIIDNTRPVVEKLKATVFSDSSCIIKGEAKDNLCHIKNLKYSLDGGDWTAIHPLDEVLDSNREPFEFTISELSAGEHMVVIKATDHSGNIGAAKTIFTAGKKNPYK